MRHNLALLEILTGDAAPAADILATLENIESEHPKTRRPCLGWNPKQAHDAESGLRPTFTLY